MMRRAASGFPLIALAAGVWLLLSGFGPYRPGAISPVSLGMGDATVAAGAGTTALGTNPAGLSQVPQHTFESGVTHNPIHDRTSLFLATADGSSPAGISAGMSYDWETETKIDGIKRSGSDMRVGFAAGLGGQATRLFLGGTLRRLSLSYVDKDDQKRSIAGWTGDAGAILALTQTLRIGVVYRNIINLDDVETPARLASGVAIYVSPVLLSGEGSWSFEGEGTAWRAGGAVQIGDSLQVRAGWSRDASLRLDRPLRRIHAGLGWRYGGIGIDVGGAMDLDNTKSVLFAATLTFFLPYTMG